MADSNGRQVMVQGRILWTCGDLFKGQERKVFGTNQTMLDAQGQPMKLYGFGLAVPKSVLNQVGPGQPGEIWAAMHEEAYALYPSRQIPPGFAMKYKDGDGLDHNGIPFSQREGYAGHYVFACTTQIPIKFFRWENGQNILITEGIKCGDYVNVQLTVKAHTATGQGKSGLYLNPNAVQFLGYGKEIINAPSGDQIFGNQAPPLPPGATAVPTAPQAGLLVSTPQPQAHYGVLPQAHQPPVQAPAMPTAVPPMAPQGFQAPVMGAQPAAPYQQPAPMPGFPGYPQQ